jgi:membrane associated rhomboid family serine protease/Zn-finger nucleic acid-binding protein
MNCPACSGSLTPARSSLRDVYACYGCGGFWFGSDNMADFAYRLSPREEESGRHLPTLKPIEVDVSSHLDEGVRMCPKCQRGMVKFNYAYDSNIILDRCPVCKGIWTDRGEIEQIAAHLQSDAEVMAFGEELAKLVKEIEEMKDPRKNSVVYLPHVIVPIGEDAPVNKPPVVTVWLIGILALTCVLFWVFGWRVMNLGGKANVGLDVIAFAMAPGGPFHLLWLILFLWLFGDNVEDCFSRVEYIVFFAFCMYVGAAAFIFFTFSPAVIIAAFSGAISGVMGAYFIFFPMANVRIFAVFNTMEVPAVICLGAWFVVQSVLPFTSGGVRPAMGVCAANICGFLVGAGVAFLTQDRVNH